MTDDTPTAVEVNCETGEVTTRPLTADEIAAQQAAAAQAEADAQAKATAEAAVAAAKASAQAKLAALGLTADEVAALTA
jgi:hypothetical protein